MSELNNIYNNPNIPWVEKYRPIDFNNIVLDKYNKIILSNILKTNYFPNLLLYGPPGTGKTTTITNLINRYQKQNNKNIKGYMIHLNASDERGIEVIRLQINQFANAKSMFGSGIKFVILDEVDYMTKNAQQALRYIVNEHSNNIRFCLIGNYISRIDTSLQNEFVRLKFNNLPTKDIIGFLDNISNNEGLELDKKKIHYIKDLYDSDIRSMINYMQTNQNNIKNYKIINKNVWENIYKTIINPNNSINKLYKYIIELSKEYNTEPISLMISLLMYIIYNRTELISKDLLRYYENIIHDKNNNMIYVIKSLILCYR